MSPMYSSRSYELQACRRFFCEGRTRLRSIPGARVGSFVLLPPKISFMERVCFQWQSLLRSAACTNLVYFAMLHSHSRRKVYSSGKANPTLEV